MIYLSDRLPSDGSDAGPALRGVLALPDNAGETFVVDGDWTLTSRHGASQVVVLRSGQRLVSETGGRLAYVQANDPAYRLGETMRMVQSSTGAAGIEIRGVRFAHRVEAIAKKQSHCLFFYAGATDLVVEGVTIEECGGGDGIYFGDGTSRVRVEDCRVRNFFRHGIVVAGGGFGRSAILLRNNVTESDPNFAYRYRPGVNVETTNPDATIDGVRIIGNRCEGAIGANYTRGEIAGNLCGSMTLSRSQGCAVTNNVIRYTGSAWAVRFIRYQEAIFRDNVIETSAGGMHIEGLANGGLPWGDVHPESALTGGGNRVLLRDPSGIALYRNRRDPADTLDTPEVWHRAEAL